ncbi:MAG TPA: hypothetical protein VKP88_04210 [Candidatus Paceibacterota bacterium]|nr:hypothetical protein [Candidatus Paceibacterota bacterium]
MPTSGTTAFAPNFIEIAEEAWERAGKEMRSGYDLRTARRSMNLLTIEWANRGINLWTVDEGSVPLLADTQTYTLPADTIDLLEQVVRTGTGTSQADITVERVSPSVWASITNKNVTGRPIQLWINRQGAQPQVHVWPIPPDNNYTLYYWRLRRIEDAGRGAETADMPFRFIPALISGLAYYLAAKTPELEPRVGRLKADYDEQFALAAAEDRVKSTVKFIPKVGRI